MAKKEPHLPTREVIGELTVGRGKKRRKIPITAEPFYLSPEEDKARVKRLARKIWDCINHIAREKDCSIDDLLSEENEIEKMLKTPLMDSKARR